jgi:hypothetical protein
VIKIRIFGYNFVWPKDEKPSDEKYQSFTPPQKDDGSVDIAASAFAASYIDLEGTVRTEAELITRYRKMALQPELNKAVDEITNECVTRDDEDSEIVKIFLDNIPSEVLSKSLKDKIEEEFEEIKKLLKFNTQYYNIFRKWYIDGRIYYHAIIDDKKPQEGIKECRFIDPRKIRKVREIMRKRGPDGSTLIKTKQEYYMYNDRGFSDSLRTTLPTAAGVKIAKDTIAYVPSGNLNENGTMMLSWLHPAIKPLNELRTMEDSTVIYRITRAPERRVWYIDVGQLPKAKAEQHVRDLMVKHRNKLIYDSQTGEIKDDRRFMTMLEDYWLPQREGRGTKVDTLKRGEGLGKMEEVEYFQKKLFESLQIPINRLNADEAIVNIGQPDQLSHAELKFDKFCSRLQQKFSTLFTQLLEKQLVLKGIFRIEAFNEFKEQIEYEFTKDNYFAELKNQQILQMRMGVLEQMLSTGIIGMYFSHNYVRKEILKQDEKEMKRIDKEIKEEQENYQYLSPDQKMMLQQQEMDTQNQVADTMAGDQQAEDYAATPEGQASQTIQQLGNESNPSLQQISQMRRAKKVAG